MKLSKCNETGVWMVSEDESAARAVAVRAMQHFGWNHHDWMLRDNVIRALSPLINQLLDAAAGIEVFDE